MAGIMVTGARRLPRTVPSCGGVPSFTLSPPLLRVEGVSVEGAPQALEAPLLRELGPVSGRLWGLREPGRAAARLRSAFPCLREVRAHRDWLARRVRFTVAVRRPAAKALRADGASAWLGDDGTVFPAPEVTFPAPPSLSVGFGPGKEPDGPAVVKLLAAAAAEGALPSPLARLDSRSAERGWEATLEDGTLLQWGDLNWTEQKLSRLREVLKDARGRFSQGLTADLRFFDDGKILVRPVGPGKGRGVPPPGFVGEGPGDGPRGAIPAGRVFGGAIGGPGAALKRHG